MAFEVTEIKTEQCIFLNKEHNIDSISIIR